MAMRHRFDGVDDPAAGCSRCLFNASRRYRYTTKHEDKSIIGEKNDYSISNSNQALITGKFVKHKPIETALTCTIKKESMHKYLISTLFIIISRSKILDILKSLLVGKEFLF